MSWILAVGVLLAFANGANDNFKGVASLLGSGTSRYGRALAWATLTTLAGSIAALVLAGELLARFRGKGLVPEELTLAPGFVGAVALGAGATVLAATRLGMPTSTTHALVGALVGAGLGAGGPVYGGVLAEKVLLPLAVSPVIALLATAVLYRLFRAARVRMGVQRDTCFCIGEETFEVQPYMAPVQMVERRAQLSATTGDAVSCHTRYRGRVLGVGAGPTLDGLHYLSAGALSFARGLNDTPKIAALLLIVPALGSLGALAITGAAIALGGLVAARRVARTMSYDITPMNTGQGFTSNLVSSLLVLVASPLGLPVSTTHVTCGALFGLGLSTGEARRTTLARILLTWLVTLPAAGLLAWFAQTALR
jgi:PiT family inorganic phosphate transporter